MDSPIRFPNRRVVTGLDSEGRSCIVIDGPAPNQRTAIDRAQRGEALLWETDRSPADNRDPADTSANPFSLVTAPGGSKFIVAEFPGRASRAKSEAGAAATPPPRMHVTDTIDYVIVARGEITLILEQGEALLRAGDVVIDRGVIHAWENRGEEDALMFAIMIDAESLRDG